MNLTRAACLILALALAACGASNDLTSPPEPFGDFRLGYAIVVDKNAKPAGPSRKAEPGEWKAELEKALRGRFDRYQGDKLYHLGVGVKAYALAVPGIPIVLSPKSVVVVTVDVWDDTAKRTINPESREFIVFEGLSGSTVIGSGLTKSKEQQMQTLSGNVARRINDWLIDNKAWFSPEAVAARGALVAAQPASAAPAAPPPAN